MAGTRPVVMSPPVRRFALLVHVTCSVGWIGAVVAYVALGVAATTGSAATVRAAWAAMEIVGWSVLLPLALGSWATGLAVSLAGRWGLLRHYWVVFSFGLTTLAVVVLVAHLPDVSAVATTVRSAPAEELGRYGGDLVHAVLALVLLVAVEVLNVYKPSGLTPYGWRRSQRDRRPAQAV